MTFLQYDRHSRKGWHIWEELPEDVKADLFKRLEKGDRRIGVYVYHSHGFDGKFLGIKCGYYVRTLAPQMYAKDKFWKAKPLGGYL